VLVRDRLGHAIQDESFGSPGKEECNPQVSSSLTVLYPRGSSRR
jgi:hypothetical protein